MRGKICIFVAALAALLALQGCMRRDAVIFQGISDVEVSMEASPRVGVVLLVENTSGRNITVRDASFVLTSRDGDGDPQPAGLVQFPPDGIHRLPDHLPGDAVDGPLPHRLVQAGAGDPAHPVAALEKDRFPFHRLHPDTDRQPMGGVHIVAAVLGHTAAGRPAAGSDTRSRTGSCRCPRGRHVDLQLRCHQHRQVLPRVWQSRTRPGTDQVVLPQLR